MAERRRRILAMVLAGGHGSRLSPLTAHRAKPAVPFGAKYRIVDFVLNNLVNSRIHSIYVLTQFRAQSLSEHIQRYWPVSSFLRDQFMTVVPAQMFRYEELGAVWYRGTADAIYQNAHLINGFRPDVVAVFGGDHVFKMDISQMVQVHYDSGADLTIAACPVPLAEASRFGVLEVDKDHRLVGFEEKPASPRAMPGRADQALASMGNYVFSVDALLRMLHEDAQAKDSSHDFGKDVIPRALAQGRHVHVYDFAQNSIPGEQGPNTYWRDIGTLDAYFDASMDLVQPTPQFDLFNSEWPLRTESAWSPPAKFIRDSAGKPGRADDCLVAGGVVVAGGDVRSSLLARRVHVGSGATVESSVVLDNVTIGAGARVRNAIIDKDVTVPDGATVGWDLDADRARGFVTTSRGVVVVPKAYGF